MQRLQPGDCLIEMREGFDFRHEAVSEKEHEKYVADKAHHGLLYSGEKKTGDAVIHSAVGETLQGVAEHRLTKTCDMEAPLGVYCVLRPIKKALGSQLVSVAEKWLSPKLEGAQREARLSLEDVGTAELLVPYRYRRRHPEEKNDPNYEVYRAFRVYWRALSEYTDDKTGLKLKAAPPSKKRGVSCSNLLGYSYKVAAIQMTFPDGAPKEILECIASVEQLKKSKNFKKLYQLNQYKDWLSTQEKKRALTPEEQKEKSLLQKFSDFSAFVRSQLSDKEQKISSTGYDAVSLMKLLQQPIKGQQIGFFAEETMKTKDDWKFIGYLCFVEENKAGKKVNVPYVINYELYNELVKEVRQQKDAEWPSSQVTMQQLDEASKRLAEAKAAVKNNKSSS